jgi:phosphoesterase RecJ-like protein
VLEASGLALDMPSATCFMAALLADTQTFRTESTSPRSLLWGYRLASLGAPIFPIAQMLFKTRPVVGVKLWGAALHDVQARDDVLWTTVTQDMLRAAGATMEEAEGLVDFLLASLGTRVAIVLKEEDSGETKVSMRTVPGVDATRIVGAFGGGGHQRAAGCTIEAPPEAAAKLLLPRVFDEVKAGAAVA